MIKHSMSERLKGYDKSLLVSGILPEGADWLKVLKYLDGMPTITEDEFIPEVVDTRYMTQDGATETSRYFKRTVKLIEEDLPIQNQ
jgi:hypothetical protein